MFPLGVPAGDSEVIRQQVGFQQSEFLGKYLGIPITNFLITAFAYEKQLYRNSSMTN